MREINGEISSHTYFHWFDDCKYHSTFSVSWDPRTQACLGWRWTVGGELELTIAYVLRCKYLALRLVSCPLWSNRAHMLTFIGGTTNYLFLLAAGFATIHSPVDS